MKKVNCPYCGTAMEWQNAGRTPTMVILYCQGCSLSTPYAGTRGEVIEKLMKITGGTKNMSDELKQAVARLREMQKWRRGEPPYNRGDKPGDRLMVNPPLREQADIDALIEACIWRGKSQASNIAPTMSCRARSVPRAVINARARA
jgi:hypothetical protein